MKLRIKPACKSRKEYIEYCKLMIKDKQASTKGLFVYQYKNNGKGQRQGVACAFCIDGKLYVGASRCNRHLHDKFDCHIGLWQAIDGASLIFNFWPEIYKDLQSGPPDMRDAYNVLFPISMHKLVCRMIFRGRRQFAPKPAPTPEPIGA